MVYVLNRYKLTPQFICFVVASLFAFFLGSLEVDAYVDRDNYLTYAGNSIVILGRYIAENVTTVIFNEPLWLLINILFSLFLPPEWVVRSIIFISSFVTTYIVLRNVELKYFFIIIFFLLLPSVLKNNIIHLRQGVGIAFFLCGWFSSKNTIKYGLFLCAALIHSSFIIILFGIISVNLILYMKFSYGLRNIAYIMIAIFIGMLGLYIANILGARQGTGYQEAVSIGSGLGFLFWGGVTFLFMLQGSNFLYKHTYVIFFLLLYLGTYFFLPVTARILESVLLVVLLAALDLKRTYKVTFFIFYSLFFMFLWFFRLNKPGFGWGIENYI
jgi:hypothetical protein